MNYGGLKTAVAAFANRTDLTAMMPTFLDLAEQRIYFGSQYGGMKTEGLRLSNMLTVVNPFTGGLPASCISIKRLSWIDGLRKNPLDFLPLERIGQLSAAGAPSYYSLQGSNVVYGPTFSQDVELVYYSRYATPSADSDTNYLLTSASNVYLQAFLIEVGIYLRDEAMALAAMSGFASSINSLVEDDEEFQHSGATLRMTTDQRRII